MNTILPQVMLFDFDGIIIETLQKENWEYDVAQKLLDDYLLSQYDDYIELESLARDLRNTVRSVSFWTNSTSMQKFPLELPDHLWLEYLSVNWNETAKYMVAPHIKDIIYTITHRRFSRKIRSGMHEVLDYLQNRNIPMGIVSNTASGQVVREFLVEHELKPYFRHEVYSNEVGIRKPNPEILHHAAALFGVTAKDTWFIGDRIDRDIACADRAGVQTSVLMDSHDSAHSTFELVNTPTYRVENPYELAHIIESVGIVGATRVSYGA